MARRGGSAPVQSRVFRLRGGCHPDELRDEGFQKILDEVIREDIEFVPEEASQGEVSEDVPPSGSFDPAVPCTAPPGSSPDPVQKVFDEYERLRQSELKSLSDYLAPRPWLIDQPEIQLLMEVLNAPPPVPVSRVEPLNCIVARDPVLNRILNAASPSAPAPADEGQLARERRELRHLMRSLSVIDTGLIAPPPSEDEDDA